MNIISNLYIALICILLLKICVLLLDLPIINNWFGLDKERRKVAIEYKLSLSEEKEREIINQKIALKVMCIIVFFTIAYFLILACFDIIPNIKQLLL